MAHLRDITKTCQTCRRLATVQLRGLRNEEYGYYCVKDGKRAERELAASEKTMYAEPDPT